MEAILSFFRSSFLCAVGLVFGGTVFAAEPLRIPLHASAISLDPTGVQDMNSLWVSRQVNCQLVRMSGREPQLEAAESVQYINPTTIRISVKPSMRFSDGNPVRASDVKASFEFLKASRKVLRNIFTWVKTIKVVDERTLILELTQTVPQFLKFLGSPNYSIYPKIFLTKVQGSKALWKAPIGCGGYKLETWDDILGVIRLAPMKEGRRIEFFLAEGKSFNPGEVEKFDILDVHFSQKLNGSSVFRETGTFDPRQILFALNTKLPRWKSRSSRCELFSKIDATAISTAYEGKAELARSLFPRGVLGYSAGEQAPTADKGSIGVSGAPEFCLAFLGLSVPVELRKAYLGGLSRISSALRTEVVEDPKTFGPSFLATGCDAFVIGLKSNYLDGYEFLLPLSEKSANFTGYENERLAKTIRESQKIGDSNLRARAYQSIEEQIDKECLIKPLLTIPFRKVMVKRSISTPGIGEVPLNEYYLGLVQ